MSLTNNRITEDKAKWFAEKGQEFIGYVMFDAATGARTIIELGAVRHVTNTEMWALMHPNGRMALSGDLIEQCAKLAEPTVPEPCDCDLCICSDVEKSDRQTVWLLRSHIAKQIRALKVEPPEPVTKLEYKSVSYPVEACPFCGAGTFEVRELGKMWLGMKHSEPSSVEIIHWCTPVEGQPSRSLVRVGRDFPSALAAWNRRAPARNIP
jgi:hypothetical protein